MKYHQGGGGEQRGEGADDHDVPSGVSTMTVVALTIATANIELDEQYAALHASWVSQQSS